MARESASPHAWHSRETVASFEGWSKKLPSAPEIVNGDR